MTNNIKRLASGFSALVLTLGSVAIAPAAYATVLEENLTLTEDVAECYTISSGQNVTLNLGEYDITCSGDNAITVENGATLTINGSGAVTTAASGKAAIYNKVGGTVIINGGAFNSENWYTIKNLGSMTIAGGSFSQGVSNTSNASLVANGWYNGASATGASDQGNPYTGTVATMTINGGTFTHYTTTSTIKSDDYSKTTINGGTFHSANGFLVQATGDVTITDGSFTGYSALLTYNADGSEDYEPGTAVISGGNVSATYMADADSAYSSLRVEGGVFAGLTDFLMRGDLTVSEVVGGTFSINPVGYMAEGYNSYDGGNGYYVIADSAFTIAFAQDEYSVAEGHDITLNATVTPTKIGASDRTDVVYSAYYTNGDELTNEEISVEGNAVSAKVGAIGTYKIVAEDMNGNTAEALLKVVAHGSLEVEDKTIYVDLSDWGDDSNVRTFAELGVTASGEGITYELSGEDNIYINDEEQTATIYGENVITWFYDGEERGKTTVKAYSVYDDSESYGIRVNGFYYYYPEYIASDGVTARIADETIAKFSTMTEQSGDEEYTQTVIEGLKAGETALEYVYDGRVVKTIPIQVYEITTTMKRAQAVGTSQTFTVTTSSGYKVAGFSVAAADSYSSEEENAEKSVEGSINKDGTFTITVNKMPVYTAYGYDDENEETMSVEKSPFAYAVFTLEDEKGNHHEEGFGIMLFEFEATDEAAEAVDDEENVAKANEKTMRNLTADTIAAMAELPVDALDSDRIELTLDSGAKVVINDVRSFADAIQNGETIEAVLTEPEKKAETELDDVEVAKLKAEMGAGKTGHRFVEINVELKVAGKTVGNITDLDNPLTVSVDVSDDAPVADGMVRQYFAVRYHDGVAERIEADYDGENKIVSFESDKFSTYLIAYTEVPEIPKAPDTGIVKD